MKKIIAVLLTIFICVSLPGCGENATTELTNIGEYEGCSLELLSAEKITTEDGKKAVRVTATYTNSNSDTMYAYSSFAVRGFQNDVELDDLSDINGNEKSLTSEIKDGQSIPVAFVFELTDNSPVVVLIGTPVADSETIGKAIYFSAEE